MTERGLEILNTLLLTLFICHLSPFSCLPHYNAAHGGDRLVTGVFSPVTVCHQPVTISKRQSPPVTAKTASLCGSWKR